MVADAVAALLLLLLLLLVKEADSHDGVVVLKLLLLLLLDAEDDVVDVVVVLMMRAEEGGVVALKVAAEDKVDGEECVVGDRKSDRIVAFKVAEGGVVVVLAIEDVNAEECAVLAIGRVIEDEVDAEECVVVVVLAEEGVAKEDDRKSDRKLVKEKGHEPVGSDRKSDLLVAELSWLE